MTNKNQESMKKGDRIFCAECGKYRTEHNYLNGIIIHERDDCPPDTVYFINGDTWIVK